MKSVLRLLVLLFILPAIASAQLRADFSMDKNGGCAPINIQFTNTSTGITSSTIFQWDLGNGNKSFLQNAAGIYETEKEYAVTLTIKDGQQTSSVTKTVTVYKRPSIAFTVSPATGCIPFQPQFTSTATSGDGVISYWHWDFGDGTTQRVYGPSVNHTYTVPQTATVTLTAVNSFGCSNTLVKPNLVTILPPIHAEFEADKTMFCNAPGTVQFSNTSTGPGALTYDWDFGDGGRSTIATPSHTYTQRGTYSVRLTVKNSQGCSDVMVKTAYINVADFTTDFQLSNLLCTNNYAEIRNLSTPVPVQNTWLIDGANSNWSYGNNSIQHIFATPGVHNIQLTADFGSCQRTITKQVTVHKTPELNGFITEITGLCGAPVKVNFKDTTAGAVSWKWNFNYYWDNSIVHSTQQSASYTYNSDNWYNIMLTVSNASGCTNSAVKQIGISRPLVGIFIDGDGRDEWCDSLKVKFNTRSTEQITSYAWKFGDGGVSTAAEPEYNYKTAGIYTVSLTYTTINGCTGTVSYNSIKIRKTPKANFSVQSLVCGNTPVFFANTTTGYATTYIWNYGDPLMNYYQNQHQFQQPGAYDVTLIAYNGMCNDTITKPAIITVKPPFASIQQVENTCEGTRGLVKFTDGSREATSWKWDFGDGQTTNYTTAQTLVNHTYTRSGTYKVVQSVTNGSCIVKDSVTIYVLLKQNPVLTATTANICSEGGTVGISLSGLSQFATPAGYTPPYYYHQVIKADGTPFNGVYNPNWYSLPWTATLSNFPPGDESIRVVSQSAYFNCFDTSTIIPVRVKGPTAAFEILANNVCFKSPVIIRDKSIPRFNTAIVKWEWNFGDGYTLTTTQAGDVQHVYSNPGTYYINLRVTDAAGCATSVYDYTNVVNVTGPKAAFATSSGNIVQLNTTVNFYNYTNTYNTTNVTWLWNFGNGVTSTDYSPTYTFTVAGDYRISLIAENLATQCRDTMKQTITVRNFNTGFNTTTSFIGNYGLCPPVVANFVNTSVGYTRLVWDFGDGFTLENQLYPSHIYEKPGTYIVRLFVYGYNGLTGTYVDTIKAGAPKATLNADDLDGCIGHKVKLNAPIHNGVSSYLWDFGNGTLVNGVDSFATHQYTHAGSFAPSLLIRDEGGCQSLVKLNTNVSIHPDPVVTVSPNTAVVCKGVGQQLQALGAVNFIWTPAAGLSNDRSPNPVANPNQSTTYNVTGTDLNGCKGYGSVSITVPKSFNMRLANVADVCKGSTVQLNADGADSYSWINTTTGLSSTIISSPVASPQVNTRYTVVGFDQYKCYSDTQNILVTVRPLPFVNAGADREVIFGSENTLNLTSSTDVRKWNWSPGDFLSCTNCAAPVCKPFSDINYVVSAYNEFNCVAKDTILIKAICTDGGIFIPSGFTPNGDGRNDNFGILGTGVSIINSFRIFNRWGEIVFERKNFFPDDKTAVWNGRVKGMEAVAGSYVYFIEMECQKGQRFQRKGTITLIR